MSKEIYIQDLLGDAHYTSLRSISLNAYDSNILITNDCLKHIKPGIKIYLNVNGKEVIYTSGAEQKYDFSGENVVLFRKK